MSTAPLDWFWSEEARELVAVHSPHKAIIDSFTISHTLPERLGKIQRDKLEASTDGAKLKGWYDSLAHQHTVITRPVATQTGDWVLEGTGLQNACC